MGVQLNIKSAEARDLAERLSRATGEGLTEAVTAALRERLERLERPDKAETKRKWLAIGADIARRYPELPTSAEIDRALYDEDGLPA
jgi:antitoxin VapB